MGESEWVSCLRSLGIVAAFPDNGWVNRASNTLKVMFVTFCDRTPVIGDLFVLGWPGDFRVVKCTGVREPLFCSGGRWVLSFQASDQDPTVGVLQNINLSRSTSHE